MEATNKPFNYHPVTPEPFYSIAPGVDADDVSNYLQAKLGHLCAMLSMACGTGGESLRTYSDAIQEDYMWSCATVAEECRALFEELTEQLEPSVRDASMHN